MIINARFAGKCPVCGEAIQVGRAVEWKRGQKARHAACARPRQYAGAAAVAARLRVQDDVYAARLRESAQDEERDLSATSHRGTDTRSRRPLQNGDWTR